MVPGDDQTPEVVDEWVRNHVTTGSIMIVRYEHNGNMMFDLDEVDLMKTTAQYLYSHFYGTFDTSGRRASERQDTTRLLIPSPQVSAMALNAEAWVNNAAVKTLRPRPPRHEAMRSKLFEQMKLSTAGAQY